MKTTGTSSKLMAIASVFTGIADAFSGIKDPEKAEEMMKLILMKNSGEIISAVTDLAVNATSADLAIMTTEVKFGASLVRVFLIEKGAPKSVLTELLEAEKSIQRYFLWKAKQLKGGMKDNKALVDLIESNMPA
jgi:hypothetical protein